MQTLLRITLLSVFAAAGVGVAIWVALGTEFDSLTVEASLDAPEKEQPVTEQSNVSPARPQELAIAPQTVSNDTTPWRDPASFAAPQTAPYHPLVAQQLERLDERVDRADESARAYQELLTTALSSLLKQPQPPIEAAPPLPPPAPSSDPLADEPPPQGEIVAGEGDGELIINIRDRDIRVVLESLSAWGRLNILASKSVTGNVTASLNGVDVPTALDAILKSTGFIARREGDFIFVGTPADFQEMDNAQDGVVTRIYQPNYVSAAELQKLITPILSPSGQVTINVGAISTSTPPQIDIPADTAKTGGDDFAGGDVLLVRDYENVLRQVDQIVAEVDCQPLQVSIESMILSVRLDDSLVLGVDFELLRDKNNVRLISGNPLTNLATIDVNDGGLKVGFLDASTSVFVEALETIGDTNVIASPRLMCLNKQRAEILIGSQLGYVSTTVTENAATQAIEFLEVGTQLRLRPFISRDGMIRMEVHPELSTGNVRVEGGFTLPDKETTQVTTNILCADGATVVIGGLIREDLSNNVTQIPLLGSLPWVGPAFRQTTENTDRREIIVLITPRIVGQPFLAQDGARLKGEFLQRQDMYFDKTSPLGTRRIGEHYLRLARAAWAAGDTRAAIRYVNLSIHFDPLSRDAIVLRNEIVAVGQGGERNIHAYLHEGLPPWQHPVRDYSKQGYPWQSPAEAQGYVEGATYTVSDLHEFAEPIELGPVEMTPNGSSYHRQSFPGMELRTSP